MGKEVDFTREEVNSVNYSKSITTSINTNKDYFGVFSQPFAFSVQYDSSTVSDDFKVVRTPLSFA